MYKIMIALMLSVGFAGMTAWADDYGSPSGTTEEQPGMVAPSDEQAGTVGDQTAVTEASVSEVTKGDLNEEIVGIKPQLGTFVYNDPIVGETAGRFAAGFTVDMNALTTFGNEKDWYAGPSSGFIYSHLGAPQSNFFGADSSSSQNLGSNMFVVPLNAKIGYNFMDNFRVAVHGGGNLVYRSIAQSIALGNNTSTDSDTSVYPNVGGDIEWGIGKNVALLLRPDVTITEGDDLFTGTLALAIPIS